MPRRPSVFAFFTHFASSLRTVFTLAGYCGLRGPGSRAPQRSESMRTFLALILVLVTTPMTGRSEDAADKILSPYFFVEGANPGVESFPLQSTNVVANISGVI